jgi:hypothetical protein
MVPPKVPSAIWLQGQGASQIPSLMDCPSSFKMPSIATPAENSPSFCHCSCPWQNLLMIKKGLIGFDPVFGGDFKL